MTEKLSRILLKQNIATSMKPYQNLKDLLVHPKDKLSDFEKSGVIYRVPCKSCTKCYIGETGRTLSFRIKKHSDVRRYTRNSNTVASNERMKSAITDHALQKKSCH